MNSSLGMTLPHSHSGQGEHFWCAFLRRLDGVLMKMASQGLGSNPSSPLMCFVTKSKWLYLSGQFPHLLSEDVVGMK